MTLRFLFLLFCVFVFSACHDKTQASASVAAADGHTVVVPAGSATPVDDTRANLLDTLLRAEDSLQATQARLGVENVVVREVHAGEGEMVPGWVLFQDDPERRVDVFLDESGEHPVRLRVIGERSAWRRSDGVRLGLTSLQLQSMNGKPFELTGFHWDYAGTIVDWRGGWFASGEASLGLVRLCAHMPEPEGYPLGEAGVLSDMAVLVTHPPRVCEYSVQVRKAHALL